jgi:hypothetical protein
MRSKVSRKDTTIQSFSKFHFFNVTFFNPRRTIRPQMGQYHYLIFRISLFGEFVHHETFSRGILLSNGWIWY